MKNNDKERIDDLENRIEALSSEIDDIKAKYDDILLAAEYNAHKTYNAMQLKHYHGRTLVYAACSALFISVAGLSIKYNFSNALSFISVIIMIISCFLFALSFILEVITIVKIEQKRRELK